MARLGVLALSGLPLTDLFSEALQSLRAHLQVPVAAIIRADGDSSQIAAADGFLPPMESMPIGGIGRPAPASTGARNRGSKRATMAGSTTNAPSEETTAIRSPETLRA